MRHARAILLMAALLLCLTATVVSRPGRASAAVTGTVVFIKDHNVWIMPADNPGAARALTTDGTSDNPYSIPAADDFGVVYAVTDGGYGDIVRMDHAGNRIGAPFRPPHARPLIDAIRPSPDGSIFTFTSIGFAENPIDGDTTGVIQVSFVDFAFADGRDSSSIAHEIHGSYAAWYGADRVIFDAINVPGSDVFDSYSTYVRGQAEPQPWFATCHGANPAPPACNIVGVPDVDRQLERLAGVAYNNRFAGIPPGIAVYELNGAPPAPPALACTFEETPGTGSIYNVMWSPDGDTLMWDYGAALGEELAPARAGLYVADGFTSKSCTDAFAGARLVVPGAAQPYWSAAPLGATPPASPTPPGNGGGTGTKVPAGGTVQLPVAGVHGVPADASAVVLNLTATAPGDDGYLTVYPCGQPAPNASNVNYTAGQSVPNLTITKIGTGGNVCITSYATSDVIADLSGWYPAGADYTPVTPTRILDTRTTTKLPAGGTVQLPVAGVHGVPADASAVVLNLTATAPGDDGYLTVYPCGQPAPNASNVNYTAGQSVPNLTITKIGTGGNVCITSYATSDVIADLSGWYPAGADYTPVTPTRILDTRTTTKLPAGGTVQLPVAGVHGVPADASAVVLNLTATAPGDDGYLTVYPCGQPAPNASNVNYTAGQSVPNLTITKIGTGGNVCITSYATSDVIADLSGWYPAGADYTPVTPTRILDTRS